MDKVQYQERKFIGMFIDLVDSTKNAESLNQIEYVEKLLLPYQNIAKELANKYLGKLNRNVRGDEVFTYTYYNEKDYYNVDDIFLMIDYTILLKIILYLNNDFNLERIRTSRVPFDIGAGINSGICILIDDRIEGYTINKTKRIEGLSRLGSNLKIVVSHSIKLLIEQYKKNNNEKSENIIIFSEKIKSEAKGISNDIEVYEILEYYSDTLFCNLEDYITYNKGNDFLGIWIEQSDSLCLNSSNFYWLSNLLVSYKFFRYLKNSNDFGKLKIIKQYINNNNYLENFVISKMILGYYEYQEKKYEKAFFYFDFVYKKLKQLKIRAPRLLCGAELLKQGYPLDNIIIHNLKEEYQDICKKNLPSEIKKMLEDESIKSVLL